MPKHRRSPLFLSLSLLAVSVSTVAAPARAESANSEPGYSYEMETDFVDGGDLKGDGPRITVRGKYARVLLIRPRTSFVQALLKSTETL
jgi:hypothetical protein